MHENSQVLTKVSGALRKEGISKATVAKDLHITTVELDSLMTGLVLTSVEGGRTTPPRKSAGGSSATRLRIVDSN